MPVNRSGLPGSLRRLFDWLDDGAEGDVPRSGLPGNLRRFYDWLDDDENPPVPRSGITSRVRLLLDQIDSGEVSVGWVFLGDDDEMPLLDADFANNRYFFDGEFYDTLAEFLTATAGVFNRDSVKSYWNSDQLLAQAAADAAVIDYDPTTGDPRGLNIEPSRVTHILNTDVLDGAGWSPNNMTVLTGQASPDTVGTRGNLITRTSTSAGCWMNAGMVDAPAVGAVITASVIAKQGSVGRRFGMRLQGNFPDVADAVFDLQTGEIIDFAGNVYTNPAATITELIDGWYLLTLTCTTVNSAATLLAISPAGDSASAALFNFLDNAGALVNAYVAAANVETGHFATSTIRNTSEGNTRAADTLIFGPTGGLPVAGLDLTEFTVLVDAYTPPGLPGADPQRYITFDDDSANELVSIHRAATTGNDTLVVTDGGVSQASVSGAAVGALQRQLLAVGVKANDVAFYREGALLGTDTSVTMPAPTTMRIGHGPDGDDQLGGWISRVTLFNGRQAELARLGDRPDNIIAWGDSFTEAAQVTDDEKWLTLVGAGRNSVINEGVGGETSSEILTRFLESSDYRERVVIIWAGRNDAGELAGAPDNIADMIAELSHERFLVLSILNGDFANEDQGGAIYDAIIDVNTALEAAYPDNYLDIRQVLVDAYDPEDPQDVIDHDNDIPPTSLRVDEIHLNADGNIIVADAVEAFLVGKGW